MRTVVFKFRQTGFNAHEASGSFTYDTVEHAQQAYEQMKSLPGYSDVRLTF
jgi:hypothetical protein